MATGDVMKTSRIAAAGLCASLALGPAIANADVVLEWNAIMVAVVADQPPPNMNRLAAITQLAVFEAVRAAAGDHPSHPGTIDRSPGVSADAAAIGAAHGVLRHYFPDRAAFLDAARARSLSTIPDGSAKVGGITIGESAAARTIAARANDGSEPPESYVPSSSNSGEWQLTSDCPATGGFFLHWRNVTPFALRRADQFRSDLPPALTSSRYTRDYKEVKEVGGRDSTERPQDRANVVQALCRTGRCGALEPDCESARGGAPPLSGGERPHVRAAEHGLERCRRRRDGHEVSLQVLASGDRDCRRREDGNDRTDADTSFVPFIPGAVFPQLSLRPCEHELRRTRSAGAHLRPAGTFHRRGQSSRTGHRSSGTRG